VTVLPPLAVLDVDGVVADVAHRLHHLDRRPKDWRGFFAAAGRDPVLEPGLLLARDLATEHEIVYLTGRPEHLRRTTTRWLDRHELPPGRLLMRARGDFRPARVIKLEALRALEGSGGTVEVVVDDDPEVVATVRGAGFAVVHATWAVRSAPLQAAQEREGRT
jgi:hypothetical protein